MWVQHTLASHGMRAVRFPQTGRSQIVFGARRTLCMHTSHSQSRPGSVSDCTRRASQHAHNTCESTTPRESLPRWLWRISCTAWRTGYDGSSCPRLVPQLQVVTVSSVARTDSLVHQSHVKECSGSRGPCKSTVEHEPLLRRMDHRPLRPNTKLIKGSPWTPHSTELSQAHMLTLPTRDDR